MSRSLLSLALLLLSLTPAWSQGVQYYSFCYTIQNTLQTSPYLPWAVQASGVLTVQTDTSVGYNGGAGNLVTAATGSRTIQWGNQQTSTVAITGVAPPGTYNGNDNIIQLASPYFDRVIHGLTFTLASTAYFAGGAFNSSNRYVNINNYTTPKPSGAGISESDNPLNDGVTNVLTSTWQPLAVVSGPTATVTCATPLPTLSYASGAVSSYATSLTWNFCYQFTGGPGDGTYDGGVWYLTASGTFTTTGYAGQVAGSSRTGYLITGVSGSRTYIAENGTQYSVQITQIGGVNSADADFDNLGNPQYTGAYYANNVLYSSYPYFDTYGVALQANAPFANVDLFNLQSPVARLFVNPSTGEFDEWIIDFADLIIYEAEAGSVVVSSSSIGSTTTGTLQNQCSFNLAPLQTYSYCYYIDATAQSPAVFSYTYGTMTVSSQVTRQGKPAVVVQSLTGVRTISVGGTVTKMNILNSQYPKEDIALGILNDNVLFQSPSSTQPPVTQNGLLFTTSYPVAFPSGTAAGNPNDILLSLDSTGTKLQEMTADGKLSYSSTNYGFSVSPYTAGSQQQCSGTSNSLVSIGSQNTFQFCYQFVGALNSYTVSASGTLTTYPTAITLNGQTGYAIASITGTRTFQNRTFSQTVPITGLLSNSSVSWDGPIEYLADNLVFTTWPYFTDNGLLYTVPAGTYGPGGAIYNVGAINLYIDPYNDVTEISLENSNTVLELLVGSVSVSAMNAAASSFNSTALCTLNPTGTVNTYSFCYYVQGSASNTYVQAYGTARGYTVNRDGRTAVQLSSMQGQRIVVNSGVTSATQQILSLIGIKELLGTSSLVNDNAVFSSAPALTAEGIIFQLDSNAVYPGGVTSGSQYVNVYVDNTVSPNQFYDWDADDVTYLASATGAFNIAPYTNTGGSSYVSCGGSGLTTPTSQTFSFCYSIVGNGYTVTASGTMTAESIPVVFQGRSGYIVTAITGTRTYSGPNGAAPVTNNIISVASTTESYNFNNIVYPSWPFFDVYGVSYVTDGTAPGPGGNAEGNTFNMYIDAGWDFQEFAYTTQYPSATTGGLTLVLGNVVVTPSATASPSTLLTNQCGFTSGTPKTYQFCYAVQPDYTYSGTGSYSIVGYGTFVADGPVPRQGRSAMTVQPGALPSQGARIVTDAQGKQTFQYINSIAGVKQDFGNASLLNDNVVYATFPALDQYGLIFTLSSPATYPVNNGTTITAGSADINIYFDQFASYTIVDWDADDVDFIETVNSFFTYSVYSASTYPPAYCQGVAVPQGSWTTQTGGVIGGGQGQSNSASSGGGSSGLSHGAIAGIVIGVVFGVLILACLGAILLAMSRGKSLGATTGSKYSSHEEPESRVDQSRVDHEVEMQNQETA